MGGSLNLCPAKYIDQPRREKNGSEEDGSEENSCEENGEGATAQACQTLDQEALR